MTTWVLGGPGAVLGRRQFDVVDFISRSKPINSDRHPSSCCYDHNIVSLLIDRPFVGPLAGFLTGLPADQLGCHLLACFAAQFSPEPAQSLPFDVLIGSLPLMTNQIAPSLVTSAQVEPAAVKRSDFVLAPYVRSNDLWATWQIVNTLVPYGLLWVAVIYVARVSIWLTPPLLVLMVLFSGRCFSLMHDCGHQSLFRSKRMNRLVGFLLGVINAIPQYPWSRGHAFHHKHNGNWDLYRGPSALVSSETFLKMTPFQQGFYQFLRHPLMLFPGGFFYLVIKPRVALLLGLFHFAGHAMACLKADIRSSLNSIWTSYKPKYWYTTLEFQDLVLNNICVVASWIILSRLVGAGLFWSLYSVVMACSAALFICIFFVQHNFEGSYAHRTEGWNSLTGAIDGTSLLRLPAILNWFTADIGYHNIHHLCSRIPNYHLRACHQRNASLLTGATTLTVRQIPDCFAFILWDRSTDSLQSVEQVQAAQA